jgi:hypothetical protein
MDMDRLTWTVLLLQAGPVIAVLAVAWAIWRASRGDPRARRAPPPSQPAKWATGTCRRCAQVAPLHPKTDLCETCHYRPLPGAAEVPDHLPDRF